jgi:phospholipase D1/2
MAGVLQPGRNCDPLVMANRFALLVDGVEYYAALARCIERARRTVVIVGWDLDSRVHLGPGVDANGREILPPLRNFLPAIADAAPHLHIYILSWNFSLLFANVREPDLVLGRNPFTHPRIHFHFDAAHRPGASHHQKVIVIDDCLAFAGGMDVAGGRWDTSEHRAHDIRRSGKDRPYAPTHDVQALVDGEAARALAAIVRERWLRATGTSMSEYACDADIWPDDVKPDLERVRVGISRTDIDAHRYEVERLHLDLIAAARQFIYVENQYLTSPIIVAALCRRLQEADGPEVLIVLPHKSSGWLEARTIDVLRLRSIRELRETDRYGRLRICYPVVPGLNEDAIQVHSKVLAIDDRLFRVGSSNLTNRSMRLDTECDLTVEASSESERRQVGALRNRLLAEHLGISVKTVDASLARTPSLLRLVDTRANEPRGLRDLPSEGDAGLLVADTLIDPIEPLTTTVVARSLLPSPAVVTKWLMPAAFCGVALTLGWAVVRKMAATSLPAKQ